MQENLPGQKPAPALHKQASVVSDRAMGFSLARLTRARVLAGMVLLSPAAVAPHAGAGEEEDDDARPNRRRMVVTVEDTEDETVAAPTKRDGPVAAPEQSAPESEIDAYLLRLKTDVLDARIALKEAKRADDDEEALRLRDELKQKQLLLKDEERRLANPDTGLIGGGATFTALGGISLVSSVVLLVMWTSSGLGGHSEPAYGWASLATLGGGALGLGAGIPMIAIGRQRRGRESEDVLARPLVPGADHSPVGMTFSASF